jgi:hypothetical protein
MAKKLFMGVMVAILMSQLAHNHLPLPITSAVPDMQYRIEIDTPHERLHLLNVNGAGYIAAGYNQQG